jgi:putative Mn2+ efflux pump MntP
VVLIFSITLGSKKLTEWQGQVLKLISGLMMLGLGSILLIKPRSQSHS